MLRPPYTRYDKLHIYHLDLSELPAIDDPDLIGCWLEDGNAILFFHRSKDELINELCRETGNNIIYQAELDYEDWEAGQAISSFTVDDLTIAPIWESGPAQIRLDPSVIFGSGFHQSTRLCLESILKLIKTPETTIDSMLDLGTGTGLLAIAAAKRGVRTITAVDHNLPACQVAQENAKLNKVDQAINIIQADIRNNCPETKVDLLVANLYQGLLTELFSTPEFWQAKFYVLAGFVSSMEPELLAALPEGQVRFIERQQRDRWCIWVLQNNRY